MLHQIALHLAKKKLSHKDGDRSTLEEQTYYIEIFLESILTLSLLLVSAWFLHLFAEVAVFIFFFMWFRGNTGGYHTRTTIGCSLLSISVALGASFIAKYWMMSNWIFLPFVLFSFSIILIFAPVNHPDLALSIKEIKQCKRTIKGISFLSTLTLSILSAFHVGPTLLRSAVLAILSTALSIAIAKILKQEVNEYEPDKN